MAKVTFDRSGMINLLEDRQRLNTPFVSVKKTGLVKFSKGVQHLIGNINYIDELLCDPNDKRFILVLTEKDESSPLGDNRRKIRTQPSPTAKRNPQTGELVKQKLGELQMKKDLDKSKLLPLKTPKNTEQKFEDGTGLTIDAESEDGKIIIELDGKKGVYKSNEKVGSK